MYARRYHSTLSAPKKKPMTDRSLFRFSPEDDFPPFPGESAQRQSHGLASLLSILIEAARCNVIEAPGKAPDDPSIVDEFGRLVEAAHGLEIAPGVRLVDHFWTHGEPFRRGEVAERLHDSSKHSAMSVDGFLALYGTDVESPILYGPNMMPFRVSQAIERPSGIPGPFLVLVGCRLALDGRAEAPLAYAQPIFHGRRFVPVASELDRDVLRALEQLQVALDAQGVDCRIERVIGKPARCDASTIELTISRQDSVIRTVRFAVHADETMAPPSREIGFIVTPATWADGGFVGWLERAILQ